MGTATEPRNHTKFVPASQLIKGRRRCELVINDAFDKLLRASPPVVVRQHQYLAINRLRTLGRRGILITEVS